MKNGAGAVHLCRRADAIGHGLVVVQSLGDGQQVQSCRPVQSLTLVPVGTEGAGFRNGLVDAHRTHHTFSLGAAAAHALPVTGQLHRIFGIRHAKAVAVAVVQRVPGAAGGSDGAAVILPLAVFFIHLAGRTGQNQRHVAPGQFRIGLQHQRYHARHHRGGRRGAVEGIGVEIQVGTFRAFLLVVGSDGGRGHAGQGGVFTGFGRGGAHRQVGAAFAVVGPFAGSIGGTYGNHPPFTYITVQEGIISLVGTVAAGKHVDAAQTAPSGAQPPFQRIPVCRGIFIAKEVPPVLIAPAVAVDMVLVQIPDKGVQLVGFLFGHHGIQTHQAGMRGHAYHAHTVAVAGGNDAGHRGAVCFFARAGQRIIGMAVGCAIGRLAVVVAAGHHVGPQVLVHQQQRVIDHRHAHAVPIDALIPRARHPQIFSALHAGVVRQAAGVLQVPLQEFLRVGTGAFGPALRAVHFVLQRAVLRAYLQRAGRRCRVVACSVAARSRGGSATAGIADIRASAGTRARVCAGAASRVAGVGGIAGAGRIAMVTWPCDLRVSLCGTSGRLKGRGTRLAAVIREQVGRAGTTTGSAAAGSQQRQQQGGRQVRPGQVLQFHGEAGIPQKVRCKTGLHAQCGTLATPLLHGISLGRRG